MSFVFPIAVSPASVGPHVSRHAPPRTATIASSDHANRSTHRSRFSAHHPTPSTDRSSPVQDFRNPLKTNSISNSNFIPTPYKGKAALFERFRDTILTYSTTVGRDGRSSGRCGMVPLCPQQHPCRPGCFRAVDELPKPNPRRPWQRPRSRHRPTHTPQISLRAIGDKVEFICNKQGMEAVEIQKDSGTGWRFLATDTRPNFFDTTLFPSPAAHWKYRAIYTEDSQKVGQWNNVAEITVGG